MKRRALLAIAGFAAGIASVVATGPAQAGPLDSVPPLCLVFASPAGVNLQFGYCPNGPSDGNPIPTP